jgi:hypothetical protein
MDIFSAFQCPNLPPKTIRQLSLKAIATLEKA